MPDHLSTSRSVSVGLLFAASVATASPRFPVGEYARTGDWNAGSLTITDTSRRSFNFRLVALKQYPEDRDGSRTRHGEIEGGEAIIGGKNAVYRSANVEDEELGTCVLAFRKSGKAIVVSESGTCWWFGVGVNASGTYRASGNTGESQSSMKQPSNPSIEPTPYGGIMGELPLDKSAT